MSYDKYNLNTGDLLLFNNKDEKSWFKYFTDIIKWGTHSNYSHIAMILKDPTFLHPTLKGYYVWESSYEGKPDPQDNKIKLGVQITPLTEILNAYPNGIVNVRKLQGIQEDTFSNELMSNIHDVAYDKPYDIIPNDWINALFKHDNNPQKTDRFWCSALIGYIYTRLGILKNNTDWSILTPNDFSLSGENIHFNKPYSLSNVIFRIK